MGNFFYKIQVKCYHYIQHVISAGRESVAVHSVKSKQTKLSKHAFCMMFEPQRIRIGWFVLNLIQRVLF